MSNPELPKFADLETLRQLPLEQLVSIIVQQQQGTLAAAKSHRGIAPDSQPTQSKPRSR